MNRRGLLKWMGFSPLSGLMAKPRPSEDLEAKIIDVLRPYMEYKCFPKLSSISVNDTEYRFSFSGFIPTTYDPDNTHVYARYCLYPIDIGFEVIYPRKEFDQHLDLKKIDAALAKPVMFIKDETIFTMAKLSIPIEQAIKGD